MLFCKWIYIIRWIQNFVLLAYVLCGILSNYNTIKTYSMRKCKAWKPTLYILNNYPRSKNSFFNCLLVNLNLVKINMICFISMTVVNFSVTCKHVHPFIVFFPSCHQTLRKNTKQGFFCDSVKTYLSPVYQ